MTTPFGSTFPELPEDTLLLINQLCDRFEQAWQSGETPSAESMLEGLEGRTRISALQELLSIEVAYRRLKQLPVELNAYQTRFPEMDQAWLESLLHDAESAPHSPPARDEQEPKSLGDYEILERLGSGGMGTVYKAIHRRMKRTVALKVLKPEVSHKPHLLQRFEREVQAAARLSHPNIVTALDAREDNGLHYLITEYVDGCDLEHLIKQQGPLPELLAVDYVLQAAQGLEYAHRQHIIHRDIKPANLLLAQTSNDKGHGVVKILDMGLARLGSADSLSEPDSNDLTKTGMVMGTAAYMAPEQARNTKQADERSDIYSLGCTLYYLLTGHTAYDGETVIDTILAHLNEPIPSLAKLTISPQVDAVFRRMVAKDPGERYGSMTEVVADLQKLKALPLPATPTIAVLPPSAQQTTITSYSAISSERKRTSKAPLVAGGLLAVGLLIAAVYWMTQGNGTSPPATPPGSFALRFDGESSYAEVPSLVPDPTRPVTLEAVVELERVRTSNVISWLGPDWMAIYIAGQGHWGVSRLVEGTSTLIRSDEPATVNERVHLAGTWNGRELRLFVNGEAVPAQPMGFSLPETSGGLYIGGVRLDLLPAEQSNRFFAGLIHAVRISDGVRYTETFSVPDSLEPDSNTLALYHFDAGQGTQVPDLSGHNHTCTIVDAEWVELPLTQAQ